MRSLRPRPTSGHVFQRKGKRAPVWYAKYRLPDGRQAQKRIGPAWTKRSAVPEGHFTKTTAQAYLDQLLAQARQGTLAGMAQTGKTFSDAADEWLSYCEGVRDCKASTMSDYRSMARVLVREFGERKVEAIASQDIELWLTDFGGSNRTRQKYLVCLGSIFKRAKKVYGLPHNPVDAVERPRVRRPARIDVLRPEEVMALVRAAEEGRHREAPQEGLSEAMRARLHHQDEQDAAIIHTAAFAGLRIGELRALRWRDVDFARRTIHVRENWTHGETTTPKGGVERAVPMAEEVSRRLAKLGRRERFTSDDDLVFCTDGGQHFGKHFKGRFRAGLKAAGLREDFRFHNLRHTFGSTVIRHADSREVMEWMGHADLTTTRRYLAFVDREDAAKRVSEAFRFEEPQPERAPA